MNGQYLCETCFDELTNHVVDVRGFEEAVCDTCIGSGMARPEQPFETITAMGFRNGRFVPVQGPPAEELMTAEEYLRRYPIETWQPSRGHRGHYFSFWEGGSVWESNPPTRELTASTGFEV